MTLLIDAGPLFAQADVSEPRHTPIREILRRERGALVTSQVVAAEVDYLIGKRLGAEAERFFLNDLAGGTYTVECLSVAEFRTVSDLANRYRDLALGLADLSLVVLAQRLNTRHILTFDERCFRTVKPLQGGAFTVLPTDG